MPDFTLYFLPGDYQIFDAASPTHWEHQLRIAGDTNRVVRLIGIPGINDKLPRLILRPLPANSFFVTEFAKRWPPSFLHLTLIGTATDINTNNRAIYRDGTGVYRDYLNRIEIENLELDGNFPAHTPFSTAANPSGFKTSAIDVWARTGRIKNVKVRNFGSVGRVPYSLVEGDMSGVESFPVMFTTFDDTKVSTPPDPVPWLVEEVEVSDFQTVHGGYGTMILGSIFTTTADTSSRSPLALLRKCVVHGGAGTIAFGAAGAHVWVLNDFSRWTNPAAYIKTPMYSSLSRHEGNITLNGGAVFNTDTGAVHDFRMRNGVYLDPFSLGMVGTAECGPGQAQHVNYQFENNLIRLRGIRRAPVYSDFFIQDKDVWGTDPNLALGRLEEKLSAGIIFQGVARDIAFRGNRITTWPAGDFVTYSPPVSLPRFRLIWPIATGTWHSTQHYSRLRSPAENVSLMDNSYSTIPFDFIGTDPLPNYPSVASFTSGSATHYTDLRWALPTPVGYFNPTGRVERVLASWNGADQVERGYEVTFGQTSPAANPLRVTLRAVEHRTPALGIPGTVPLVGTNLWLRAELSTVSGGTSILGPFPAITDSSGLATYSVNLGTHTSAWVRLKGWLAPAGSTSFDPTAQAWASHDVSIGNVVQVNAEPDVADDKNAAASKRAILKFTRTSTSGTLPVTFRLPGSGVPELISPVDSRNLLATYGNGADYVFGSVTGGSLSTIIQSGANTVTFNSGSAEVQVPVAVNRDNWTEANVIRVTLQAGSNYALGKSTQADVMIYDGPLWDLVELSPSGAHQTTLSAAFAINDGITNASGQFTVNPRIVGRWSYFGMQEEGGAWNWPVGAPVGSGLNPMTPSLATDFFPRGVSYWNASPASAWVAGYQGSNARLVQPGNSPTWITLGHFSAGPSAALALSTNGMNVSGYSLISGNQRAVAWFNRGSATDLAGSSADGVGRAYGINDAGVAVGQASLKFASTSYPNHPFRTAGNSAGISAVDDILPPPLPHPNGTGEGSANAVNTKGVTVGWYNRTLPGARTNAAVIWTARLPGSTNAAGTDLGVWYPAWLGSSAAQSQPYRHVLSRGLALNDAGNTVGWSGPLITTPKAMYKPYNSAPWQDLNDRHFVNYQSGWVLLQAVGINNQRLVIGTGTLSGSPRGFVLVPRTPGP